MAHAFQSIENTPIPERRTRSRQRVLLSCLELGDDNGGIVLNISEGGLALRAVAELVGDELPRMRFQFSQFQTWVEAEGEIVWKSDSKKTAGVRFVGLPLEARHRIQTWILSTSEESGTVAQSLDLEKQEFTIAIPLSEKVNPIPIATSAAENVFSLSYPGSANGRNTNENVQSNGPRTRLWISMAILIGIAFLSLVAFKKLHLPTIIYGVQGRKEEPTAAKAPLPATVTLGKPPSARPEAVIGKPLEGAYGNYAASM